MTPLSVAFDTPAVEVAASLQRGLDAHAGTRPRHHGGHHERPCSRVTATTSLLPQGATLRRAPDIVLLDGRIFTTDTPHPWAAALSIRGDRIVAVGTTASVSVLAGPKTRRLQLEGRVVVPGFNDAHRHLSALTRPSTYAASNRARSAGATPKSSAVGAILRYMPAFIRTPVPLSAGYQLNVWIGRARVPSVALPVKASVAPR